MDPLSVAGLGLGAASLALQIFASCVKGYQLLIEMDAMPEDYEHLRIRLRIEQARFLDWGDKIGLVEEILDQSNLVSQMSRGPVLAILVEIQRLFKACLLVEATMDVASDRPAANKENDSSKAADLRDNHLSEKRKVLLKKTLKLFDKALYVRKRLQWAMVKHDAFEKVVQDLISFNDSIVSLLDRSSIDELRELQVQNQLISLQLCTKVEELKQLSLAMQCRLGKDNLNSAGQRSFLQSAHVVMHQDSEDATLASLASFKARQTSLDAEASLADMKATSLSEVKLVDNIAIRSEAFYKNRSVWVEWKQVESGARTSDKVKIIEQRIKKLTVLLAASAKPALFKSPDCLGFCRDVNHEKLRYGLIFDRPQNPASVQLVSLFTLFKTEHKMSLTHRISLAHAIAQSLMYLHSVNWLHKGLRSDNIIFFTATDTEPDIGAPIVAGFEYARPDRSNEETDKPRGSFEHNLYRHPEVLGAHNPRSRKSHDIYSLGVVLIEIAMWQPAQVTVANLGKHISSRMSIGKFRQALLDRQLLAGVEMCAGQKYRRVVERCLLGGSGLGIPPGADESDPTVGATMLTTFAEEIVAPLRSIQI